MLKYKFSVILVYHNRENSLRDSLKSIISHTSKNTEIVCVNNGSDDSSVNIVLSFESEYSNIKLINFPQKADDNVAKTAGLGIASGDFVYFTDGSEIFDNNIFDKIYSSSDKKLDIKNGIVYKRDFLENNDEVSEIIENKINEKMSMIDEKLAVFSKDISSKLEKFEQITADNIQNKIYNLICRLEQSEKFLFDKNNEYKMLIESAINEAYKNKQEDNKYLYDEISKVYDSIHDVYEYINKEVEKKTGEVNKIYEEITKNYSYTENIIEEKNSYITREFAKLKSDADNLKYESDCKFENIKELIDLKINTLCPKNTEYRDTSGSSNNNSIAVLSENLDKVYQNLNLSTEALYKEISSLYSGYADKLNEFREEQKWLLNKTLSEFKEQIVSDIHSQISLIKEETDVAG